MRSIQSGDPVTTFLDALYSLIGMTEDDMNTPGHSIEYEGRTYITPSLIDHDDGKETNGRAAD